MGVADEHDRPGRRPEVVDDNLEVVHLCVEVRLAGSPLSGPSVRASVTPAIEAHGDDVGEMTCHTDERRPPVGRTVDEYEAGPGHLPERRARVDADATDAVGADVAQRISSSRTVSVACPG